MHSKNITVQISFALEGITALCLDDDTQFDPNAIEVIYLDTIEFVAEPGTEVTITSTIPEIEDTVLFDTEPNIYAAPGAYTVQAEGGTYTFTAGELTGTITVSSTGRGTMRRGMTVTL